MESAGSVEELWAQIEAAEPLSGDEGPNEPPPGVDPLWWAERSLTQEDRRRTFIALYAWAVPTREAIAAIAGFVAGRSVIEVCAGNGLWAKLLTSEGTRVIATDGSPIERAAFVPVEALEAEAAVRAHPECEALLLCWPPMRDECAIRALSAFAGDRVVYVGDQRFTAERHFHETLERDWSLDELLPLPSWPGLDDAVRLYRSR